MTSSCAVAAGVQSIATTRMIPTAWMLTTIVTPSNASSRYSRRVTGRPDAAAPAGSNVAYRSSLRRTSTTTSTMAPRTAIWMRSVSLTPRTLPSR